MTDDARKPLNGGGDVQPDATGAALPEATLKGNVRGAGEAAEDTEAKFAAAMLSDERPPSSPLLPEMKQWLSEGLEEKPDGGGNLVPLPPPTPPIEETKKSNDPAAAAVWEAIKLLKERDSAFRGSYSEVENNHRGAAQKVMKLKLPPSSKHGGKDGPPQRTVLRCTLLVEPFEASDPSPGKGSGAPEPVLHEGAAPLPATAADVRSVHNALGEVLKAVERIAKTSSTAPVGVTEQLAEIHASVAELKEAVAEPIRHGDAQPVPEPTPDAIPDAEPVAAEEDRTAGRKRKKREEREGRDEPPTHEREQKPARGGRGLPIMTAISLVLLLVVGVLVGALWRRPEPKDHTAGITQLRRDLEEAREQSKELAGKVDKVASQGANLPTATADEVARKAQFPDKLAKQIANEVTLPSAKDIAKGVELPPPAAQELWELKAAVASVGAKLPSGTPPQVTAELAAIRQTLDVLAGRVPGRPGGAVPTDVCVVITHGRGINANEYKKALTGVFTTGTQARGKDAPVRSALVVATGKKLGLEVPLEEPAPRLKDFGVALPENGEEPEDFGGTLAGMKELQGGRPRRAVLVASAGCTPASPEAAGWRDFREVHVVLIERPNFPLDPDKLAKWHAFAWARNGSVSLIRGPEDVERQNRALKGWLEQLLNPIN